MAFFVHCGVVAFQNALVFRIPPQYFVPGINSLLKDKSSVRIIFVCILHYIVHCDFGVQGDHGKHGDAARQNNDSGNKTI